jgi:hypothetical protein
LLGAIVAAAEIVVDPYDTGRLTPFGEYGVPAVARRLSAAGLARRKDVDAAIIGNSTIQHLDPVRLKALTGLNFVSLALAATGPIEQLAVARWLVRHHDGKSRKPLVAIVLDVDTRWCRGDGTIELTNPFPFWLYADSDFTYAINLLGLDTLGAVGKKIRLMLGHGTPLRADGYFDYDSDWPWNTEADLRRGTENFETFGMNFAGADRLRKFLTEVPAQTLVVLLFPPRYYTALPVPGTPYGEEYAACEAAYAKAAASHPRTAVLDLLKDDPLLHKNAYFLDRAHYLSPISDKVEDAIAEAIGGGGVALGPPEPRPH